MTDSVYLLPLSILLLGGIIVLAGFVKSGLEHLGHPIPDRFYDPGIFTAIFRFLF